MKFVIMHLKALLLLTASFITGCLATRNLTDSKCKLYQTGSFIQNEYNESGLGHWKKMSFLISRTDSTEFIVSKRNILPDDTSYYNIKWLTPCSYELTYVSSTNTWVDSLVKKKLLSEKQTYFIIKATEKYYIQKEDDEKDTIWIR